MIRNACHVLLCLASLAVALPAIAADRSTLTVFAAASLDAPFRELAREFERGEAGMRVRFNLAGSQQLAAQIQQGASADIFASADEHWMAVVDSSGALANAPVLFAHNALTVVIPRTNPARIARLEDLARRGIKLVIGAQAVPVGHYTREMLQKLGQQPGYPPGYARRVLANTVSEEENVRSVVNKVQLGEADAGVVYHSDVSPALARYVREFPIPHGANVIANYPIAVLRGAAHRAAAERFVALVLSERGQAILASHRMQPAAVRAR